MDTVVDVSLVDDLQELSLEKNIQTFKSDEELQRHTVDEHLSTIERSVYLLSSGQEVQRFSVINNLPDILEDHNAECMRRVVPKVREVLHVAQAEMQLAACSAFLQILQKDLVPIQNYTQTFLQSILTSLDSRDPEIANAWLETLLDVIDLLPKDVIKRDIITFAIAKGQLSQSVQSRLACCRVLGKIATKFEPFVIKKDILPVVQSLCQDVDYEVRGCMCRQLDPVARGLGLEQTKSAILPELLELANDEESYVRLAGLETVVNVLSLLDDETCVNTIIPLVCKFCQQALASEDSTLPAVAKQLGRLCHGLSVNLAEDQKKWFLDYFKKLCKLGLSDSSKHKDPDPPPQPKAPMTSLYMQLGNMEMVEEEDPLAECRRNAGFNFPAMVMFCGSRYFKSELLHTFCNLCDDPNFMVRRTVASGFHEVAKLLGNNAHIIQSELLKLLNDDFMEVSGALVSHLPETLEILSKACGTNNNNHEKPHPMVDLLPGLINCEAVISLSNNWRLQAEFMDKLACLPRCFHSEDIYHCIMPLMFRKLHSARAIPVRLSSVWTLLVLLSKNHRLEQRLDMCQRLREEFCRGRSCYQRNLYIEVCKMVLQLFSRAFFKEHFYESLLELSVDPVANVRLRLCPLLPQLKRLIRLPADRQLLQLLESCVRKLLVNERDRDVLDAIEQAVQALDRIEIHMDTLNKKSYMDGDVMDQKREEAERRLLDIEEQEKREEMEAARSAKGERRRQEGKKEFGSRIPAPRKGSKIPAATSISREKPGSSNTTRSERSSSFGGTVSSPSKDVKRSPSLNSKITGKPKPSPSRGSGTNLPGSPRPPHRRMSPTSANSTGSRKNSASSVSSHSSVSSPSSQSSTTSRRSLIGVATGEAGARRTSLPGSQKRRVSTGSMGTNGSGSGIALRKK